MADFVFPMPGSSPTPVKPPKPGPRLKPIPVVRNGKPVTATEVNKEKKINTKHLIEWVIKNPDSVDKFVILTLIEVTVVVEPCPFWE